MGKGLYDGCLGRVPKRNEGGEKAWMRVKCGKGGKEEVVGWNRVG